MKNVFKTNEPRLCNCSFSENCEETSLLHLFELCEHILLIIVIMDSFTNEDKCMHVDLMGMKPSVTTFTCVPLLSLSYECLCLLDWKGAL